MITNIALVYFQRVFLFILLLKFCLIESWFITLYTICNGFQTCHFTVDMQILMVWYTI